ncbi:thioredoxin family protein [Pseudotenacibaculum sp. MALMAid0570]|uniref:thioredoxin family protein n=1 Tax=Pseudotenacibaculum sp. MALMAid0570 TaxID=3143938 RepID=UPI0032E0254A
MKKIIENSLQKGISYDQYRKLVSDLLQEGKSTGATQSESLLNYSMLNDRRMKRLDKTIQLSQETIATAKELKQPVTWLVLTEGWCGDAAQTLPIINKIANESSQIDLKIVLRDENEDLMNQFLTNGGKSIPKLIALDQNNEVVNSWGPRPSIPTKMVEDYKEQKGKLDDEFKKDLQVWYNKDKGKNTQEDMLKLL